jgi:ABC-2 type transport system permease protein
MSDFPVESQTTERAAASETRPLYWSVRRELWENRLVALAPLFVAVSVQFSFLFSTIGMPSRRRAVLLLDAAKQRAAINEPYYFAALVLIAMAVLIAVFYCLDAMHGERRDRSILFWKSLPVSDRTTVIAKAAIPLLVLPLYTFAIVVATQFTMLLLSSAVLLRSGLAATTWTHFLIIPQAIVLLYGLIVLALWHAPIYAWLLMVSAWAKRATFLWAVLPFVVPAALERMAFKTQFVHKLLGYRIAGFYERAFAASAHRAFPAGTLTVMTPGRFLATPGLWIGLIVAVAFLALTIRLRRYREPI